MTLDLLIPGCALIVDDDTVVRGLLRASLERAGIRVEEAADGRQALDAFQRARPDIVLLDVVMPHLDGFETCAAMRRLPGGEHLPIVMLTGLDDTEAINRAYIAGATDFITKPINWPILAQRVRYMLRAYRNFVDLAKSEERFATAQRIARLGHGEWDPKSGTMSWSDAVYAMLGLTRTEAPPSWERVLEACHPTDRKRLAQYLTHSTVGAVPDGVDFRLQLQADHQRIVRLQVEPSASADGTGSQQVIFQDVTAHKLAEEQIRYLEFYDDLTGLPNRRWLREQLSLVLPAARRNNELVAVLLLDLDQFKRVNDTLGHSVGDRLLQRVALRIQRCLREVDRISRTGTDSPSSVAWLGGDEFTILLSHLSDVQDIAKIAPRILEAVAHPVELEGMEMTVSGSIGIAVYPTDGHDPDTLLKNADTAMYHAKEDGRNRFHFYDQGMNSTAVHKLALENELRKAIERREFVLYYQPQVDTMTGRVIGAEALIRWQHPDGKLRLPGDFMPVVEQSQLCVPVADWVLSEACRQNKAWQRAGLAKIPIAVNMSGRHFKQPGFVATVIQSLTEVGLDPKYLELEVTETILLRDLEVALPTLDELRRLGIKLAIDDFGTGYSSLNRLKRLPLDKLKIDRSFVREIATDPDDAAITTAIIAMAHSLKLGVIAEGVESEQQAAFLRQHGCREMQGYLYGKPMPADEFARLLAPVSEQDRHGTLLLGG